jgi:hypothetical protein
MQKKNRSYYRYRIRKFDFTNNNNLLVIYNFVRNVLKFYLSKHVRRFKNAFAAFFDSNKSFKSSDLFDSNELFFAAFEISLTDDNFQQDFQY